MENQPGGGGAIGQGYVAKTAEADGYTLLAYTASVITNTLLKDVPFTVDDLKVIVCMNSDPAVMIARPDAPFDDVEGLLEYAKSNTLLVNDSGLRHFQSYPHPGLDLQAGGHHRRDHQL